jgi:hypothetical protein
VICKKLRFNQDHAIHVDGAKIEGRIVYGHFPYGYGKDCLVIPEIVIDRKGTAYRPLDITTKGPWCIVSDAYLKRTGLSRKQIGGTVARDKGGVT